MRMRAQSTRGGAHQHCLCSWLSVQTCSRQGRIVGIVLGAVVTNCPRYATAALALTSPAAAASIGFARLSALPSLLRSAPYLRIFLAVGGRQVYCRTSASPSYAQLNGVPSSSASRHCAANALREPYVQPWPSPLSAVEAEIDLKSFNAIHKSKLSYRDCSIGGDDSRYVPSPQQSLPYEVAIMLVVCAPS